MTRLELLTKILADFSGKTPSNIRSWANKNMSKKVRKGMSVKIQQEQVDSLIAEYRSNPAAVIATIVKSVGGMPD